MKPVDMLGFGPTRTAVKNPAGGYNVTVTPPEIVQMQGHTLHLTDDQYIRYQAWNEGGGLIQDVLPDLTGAQREILMTGMGDDDFQRLKQEGDEPGDEIEF